MKTIPQTVKRSRATSKLDLSRRPPLARARTLPNSLVQRVTIRLVSLKSVPRMTRAVAFSMDMGLGSPGVRYSEPLGSLGFGVPHPRASCAKQDRATHL